MHSSPNIPPRNRHGFTLIELLVVIAVIAILAAILLPALARAKSRALAANDINNCKQCMMASNMYALDNNDFLAPPGWGTPNSDCWIVSGPGLGPLGPCSAATFQTTYNGQLRYFNGIGAATGRPGLLYQFIKAEKLLLCPQDLPDANYYMRTILITSYVWNGAVIGYGRITPAGTTYKLTKFRASSILQWENDEKNTSAGNWNDFSNYPIEGGNTTFSKRHGKAAQVGRMDGSAARIPAVEMTGLARGTGAKNDLWCNPGSPDGH